MCSQVDQDEEDQELMKHIMRLMNYKTTVRGHEETGGRELAQVVKRRNIPVLIILYYVILCSPVYHLMDACPQPCKVYSVAVAISISLFIAEHSFLC